MRLNATQIRGYAILQKAPRIAKSGAIETSYAEPASLTDVRHGSSVSSSYAVKLAHRSRMQPTALRWLYGPTTEVRKSVEALT
jgi:hypothetical protein